MQMVLEILGGWLALSCTLGPVLAWAFFYPQRREAAIESRRARQDGAYVPSRASHHGGFWKGKILTSHSLFSGR
jgi:hypothetical protein